MDLLVQPGEARAQGALEIGLRPGDRVVTVAFLPVDNFNALPRWPQALCPIGDAVEPAESDAQCPSTMVCLADYIVYVPSPAFGSDEAILVARPAPPEAEGEGQAEGEGAMPAMPAMPATPPPGMPMPPK